MERMIRMGELVPEAVRASRDDYNGPWCSAEGPVSLMRSCCLVKGHEELGYPGIHVGTHHGIANLIWNA